MTPEEAADIAADEQRPEPKKTRDSAKKRKARAAELQSLQDSGAESTSDTLKQDVASAPQVEAGELPEAKDDPAMSAGQDSSQDGEATDDPATDGRTEASEPKGDESIPPSTGEQHKRLIELTTKLGISAKTAVDGIKKSCNVKSPKDASLNQIARIIDRHAVMWAKNKYKSG